MSIWEATSQSRGIIIEGASSSSSSSSSVDRERVESSSPSPVSFLLPWSYDLSVCKQGECVTRFPALPKSKLGMFFLSSGEVNQTQAAIEKAKNRIRTQGSTIREVQRTLDRIGNREIRGHGTEGALMDKIAVLRREEEKLGQV